MSKLTITINTDNAAFEDDFEIARVLKQAANLLVAGIHQGTLRDSNGNKVGQFTTKGE